MTTFAGDEHLVIGEAVALDLPVAGIGTRVLAAIIDVTVTVTALLVGTQVVRSLDPVADTASLVAVSLIATVAVFVGLPTTVETLSRGKSAGKAALGLRVVREDGGSVAFRQSLTRALVGVVEVWLLTAAPALVTMVLNARSKRLGDLAAGTLVVRDRMKLELPVPVQMPPRLASWAHQVDLGRLPDSWALSARQLELRRDRLTPGACQRLTEELAAEAGRQLNPPPPPGSTPLEIIHAVLALRRERDAARLARQIAQRKRLFAGHGELLSGP